MLIVPAMVITLRAFTVRRRESPWRSSPPRHVGDSTPRIRWHNQPEARGAKLGHAFFVSFGMHASERGEERGAWRVRRGRGPVLRRPQSSAGSSDVGGLGRREDGGSGGRGGGRSGS